MIPDALGMDLIFTENGPKFANAIQDGVKPRLNFKPEKLEYIYKNIKQTINDKKNTPLIGFCEDLNNIFIYVQRK